MEGVTWGRGIRFGGKRVGGCGTRGKGVTGYVSTRTGAMAVRWRAAGVIWLRLHDENSRAVGEGARQEGSRSQYLYASMR